MSLSPTDGALCTATVIVATLACDASVRSLALDSFKV